MKARSLFIVPPLFATTVYDTCHQRLLAMVNASFSLEHAKSGRSKCKKCKTPIAQGEFRLGKSTQNPGDDFSMTSWYHPGCMPWPKEYKKEGITEERFVEDILEDNTEEHILQTRPEEVIALLKDKTKTPTKKKVAKEDTKIAKIKARIEEHQGDEPPKKKQKTLTEEEQGEMELYNIYSKKTNDELKDILRWNKQPVSGAKNLLLLRVIDGHMHGRIGTCVSCNEGRLKIEDETGDRVVCMGYFDEDTQTRIPCNFTAKLLDVPRIHPWFTQEPTEEEIEEMEAAKDEDDPATEKLIKLAEKLDWDPESDVQKASVNLVEFLIHGDGPKVDIPDDPAEALKVVGPIVLLHKSADAKEVVRQVVEKFDLKEQNEAKAEKKKHAAEDACACPANAPILEAMQELRELYFAEGNRNAGITYNKAANAILTLDYEITEDNAKKMGKPGKSKVDGIGKGTAEKIHEFLTTGKIEKLEEKRANAQ